MGPLCAYCSRRAHGQVLLGVGSCKRCVTARQWALDHPMTETTGETKDGTGSADHDISYAWGTPRGYLTLMVQARLQILKGLVMDARAGDHRAGGTNNAADGDLDAYERTDTGIFVPTPPPPPALPPPALPIGK